MQFGGVSTFEREKFRAELSRLSDPELIESGKYYWEIVRQHTLPWNDSWYQS